ncbi:MAG: sensor histidine kinase [Acidobacteria bacterium]|nr:sensor histidine kinase [Acidobacteriota bacterium]
MTGPSRRSGRERRRAPVERVLRRRDAAQLFAGVRRPLHEALARLAAQAGPIDRRWRQLLRLLQPGREEFEALARLHLKAHVRALRVADYDAYLETIRRHGQALARAGVPEEHAVAALAFHLESCLGHLLAADQRALALALVRLTAAIQRFVLKGYGDGRGEGWRRVDDQERLRLSRDLHDEVGADLVVMKLYIEMIALELSRGNVSPIGPKLQEVLDLVSRSIDSVRRLTLDLGPAVLEQLGFLPALRLYTRQFSVRTGIQVEVREAGPPTGVPAAHETALYRVLQGALSNVAKHAKARNVRVTLGGFKDAVVVMIVEDDGVGFDVSRLATSRAFGISAMRERVQSLGGRLHVESRPARAGAGKSGTRIEIDLPLKQSDAS